MAPRTRDIAGYRSAELIGQGGFSAVYKAADPDHGREVAIKVLDGTLGDAERRRFDRERQTMGRLGSHPNIIPVYESGYTETGEGYIVMQLATGGSLGTRLRSTGPLPWPEAVEIMAAVAAATQAAHDHGVLHRDIKPDNILIDEYGNPKLSDFGIAAVANNVTATMSTTATLAHAAPELLQGQTVGNAVDIYALGSTLFTLFTGLSPFMRPGDEGVTPMITRALTEPPPDLRQRGLPDSVARIVEQSLAKEPSQRQATAAAMAAELKAVLAQVGQTSGPTIAVSVDQAPLPPPLHTPNTGPRTPTVDPGHPLGQPVPTGAGPTGFTNDPTGAPAGSAGWPAPPTAPRAPTGPAAGGAGSAGYGADPAAGQPTALFGSPTTVVQPTELQPGYGPPGYGQPGYNLPSYGQTGQGQPGYGPPGPDGPYRQPPQPAPKRRSGTFVWVGLVAVVAVGAVALVAALIASDPGSNGTTTSTAATATVATGPPASTTSAPDTGTSTSATGATGTSGATAPGSTPTGATVAIDCPDQVALNSRTICTINSAGAVSGTWTLPGFLTGPQKIDTVPGASQIFVSPTSSSAVGKTFVITATITDASGATASVSRQFTVVGLLVRINCPDSIVVNSSTVCEIVTANATEGEWSIPDFGGKKLTTVPGSNPISINPTSSSAVGRKFTITAVARDASGASATATHDFVVTGASS